MFCSECGAKIQEGATACPNGHTIPIRTGNLIARLLDVVRKEADFYVADLTNPSKVRLVVIGYKVAAALLLLSSIVGAIKIASLPIRLGIGNHFPLLVLTVGITMSAILYMLAVTTEEAVMYCSESVAEVQEEKTTCSQQNRDPRED